LISCRQDEPIHWRHFPKSQTLLVPALGLLRDDLLQYARNGIGREERIVGVTFRSVVIAVVVIPSLHAVIDNLSAGINAVFAKFILVQNR
jgi:hypothetical protein